MNSNRKKEISTRHFLSLKNMVFLWPHKRLDFFFSILKSFCPWHLVWDTSNVRRHSNYFCEFGISTTFTNIFGKDLTRKSPWWELARTNTLWASWKETLLPQRGVVFCLLNLNYSCGMVGVAGHYYPELLSWPSQWGEKYSYHYESFTLHSLSL